MATRKPKKLDVNENIRRVVRAYLDYRQMTQQHLANRIGLSYNLLNARLNGWAKFTPEELYLMADALGVEVGDFYKPPPEVSRIISGYTGKSGLDSAEPGPSRRTAA